MENNKGFLDDTSISKTPKSPLQTSTATKVLKRTNNASKNLQNASFTMNSLFQDEPVQALNEVTNMPNFISKLKLDQTRDSVDTDANSSLGILQMDNFSDIADNSLSVAANISKTKKKSKKKSTGQNKESLKAKITASNAEYVFNEGSNEIGKERAPDVEYDGANITEQNFNSEDSILFIGKSGNHSESKSQENIILASKSSQSFDDTLEKMRSEVSRDSIFESFEPSYDFLLQQLMPDKLNVDRKTSVSSLNNLSIDSILRKDNIDEESFIQNVKKLSSIQFCPEEISAQSSSSRSVSEPTYELTSSFNDSVFHKFSSDSNRFNNENLKDIQSDSCKAKMERFITLKESALNSPNSNKDSSTGLNSVLLENDVPCTDRGSNLSFYNFGLGKISNASNSFLSSSQLGISDSEFIKSGVQATEFFKKEEELAKQEYMFELGNEPVSEITSKSLTSETSTFLSMESQNDMSSKHCQLSVGAIFGARTENLGTLSEDSKRERPYFGIKVTTPPKDLSQHSSDLSSFAEYLPSTNSVSACKEQESTSNDVILEDHEDKNKFRYSALSEIFSEVSTSRPSRLASEIFKKCFSFNNSAIKEPFTSKLEEDAEKECENGNSTQDSSKTLLKHSIKGDEIDSLVTSSLNSTLTEADQNKDITLSSELNIRSSGQSEKNSDGVGKYKTCPNCQCSLQNMTSSERPPSCCSTESIPITFPNPPHEPFHATTISTKHFPSNSHNCLHSGMIYNTCSLFGTMPPQALNFPAYQTLPGNLPGYQFLHLQGASGFGCVLGPSELYFPEKISIGDTQMLKLTVQNKQNLPCLYQISSISATINNVPVSLDLAGVNFPSMMQCVDGNSTNIQITLTPKYEGKIEVNLQVIALFTPADPKCNLSQDMSLKTAIKFESLRPSISISSKGNTYLDMGPVIAGSTVVEYVTIENCKEVAVPLCLTLSCDVNDHRIHFGLNQMKNQMSVMGSDLRILSPKVIFYRLPQTRNNSSQSRLEIPIIFVAGNSSMDANFSLRASFENPVINETLAFLNISAHVRVNELVITDPSQNPVYFHIKDESLLKKSLTVKNQGSLPVTYDLQIEGDVNSLSVSPSTLTMKPMEKAVIHISFISSFYQETKSSLKAAAQPYGKAFTVVDIIVFPKKVDNSNARLSLPRASEHLFKEKFPSSGSKNVIEVNKKYLAWGGVNIGSSVTKTFTMRNTLNKSIQVKLFIKEASQSFQLLNDQNEKLQSLTMDFGSKEQKQVSVQFAPSQVILCSGLLGMKPVLETGKIMFSMPLTGYGGTGKLKVLGVPEKEGIGYCLDIFAAEGKITYNNITVQNTGVRAIFVKILTSSELPGNSSEKQLLIHPSEFILLEHENKTLFVSCNFSRNNYDWNAPNNGMISIIYGDELMRQQLRRLAAGTVFANPVPGINFNVHYEGEERVANDSSYRNSPKDISLFAASLKKVFVHINLVDQDVSLSRMNFGALSTVDNSLMGDSAVLSRRLTTVVQGHSPPVKEYSFDRLCRLSMPVSHQLFPNEMSCQTTVQEENYTIDKKEYWIIKPEELTLDATSKDNRVLLINLSKQDLKFRVECAIEVVSISPVEGVLPANGQLGLRIVIIQNSHKKLSEDYNGCIKIICGGTEKSVHVKVPQDQKRGKEFINSTTQNLDTKLEEQETTLLVETSNTNLIQCPSDDSLSQSSIYNINNFPKEITLADVIPGGASETVLLFQNTESSAIDWSIHPMSIMFSESLEYSLWKATVFKITPSSGTMGSMETTSLRIAFFPSCLDNYSQFFEISFKFENGIPQKRFFKIFGKGAASNLQEKNPVNMANNEEKSADNCNRKKTRKGVYLDSEICNFPSTVVGEATQQYITLKNNSSQDVKLNIVKPKAPFSIKQSSVVVRSKKFLKLPVTFKPMLPLPFYEDKIVFGMQEGQNLMVKLKGICTSKLEN